MLPTWVKKKVLKFIFLTKKYFNKRYINYIELTNETIYLDISITFYAILFFNLLVFFHRKK